jgi:hypothetical protein
MYANPTLTDVWLLTVIWGLALRISAQLAITVEDFLVNRWEMGRFAGLSS